MEKSRAQCLLEMMGKNPPNEKRIRRTFFLSKTVYDEFKALCDRRLTTLALVIEALMADTVDVYRDNK